MAERVEAVIRDRIVFLAENPNAGHWRKDLITEAVRFFPVYSYLIVYVLPPGHCKSSRCYMAGVMLKRSCGSALNCPPHSP